MAGTDRDTDMPDSHGDVTDADVADTADTDSDGDPDRDMSDADSDRDVTDADMAGTGVTAPAWQPHLWDDSFASDVELQLKLRSDTPLRAFAAFCAEGCAREKDAPLLRASKAASHNTAQQRLTGPSRTYLLHAALLAERSTYFHMRLAGITGGDTAFNRATTPGIGAAPAAAAAAAIVGGDNTQAPRSRLFVHVMKNDEWDAAHAVLRHCYTGELGTVGAAAVGVHTTGAPPGVALLLQMMVVAYRWRLPACVAHCYEALARLTPESHSVASINAVLDAPKGLQELPSYTAMASVATERLLHLFGDAEAVCHAAYDDKEDAGSAAGGDDKEAVCGAADGAPAGDTEAVCGAADGSPPAGAEAGGGAVSTAISGDDEAVLCATLEDAPDANRLHRRFLRLSLPSVLALLSCDRLAARSENSVLAMASQWLSGRRGAACSAAQVRQVAATLRLSQLSRVYLVKVLPQLGWLGLSKAERKSLVQLAAAAANPLVQPAAADSAHHRASVALEGHQVGPAAWYATRPRLPWAAGPPHLGLPWEVTRKQLAELLSRVEEKKECDDLLLRSRKHFYNGFEVQLVLGQQPPWDVQSPLQWCLGLTIKSALHDDVEFQHAAVGVAWGPQEAEAWGVQARGMCTEIQMSSQVGMGSPMGMVADAAGWEDYLEEGLLRVQCMVYYCG